MNSENNEQQSCWRELLDQVVNEQSEFIHENIEDLKQVILDFLNAHKEQIRAYDYRKMVMTVQREQVLFRLQKYIYNSLLIYEGQGVVAAIPR